MTDRQKSRPRNGNIDTKGEIAFSDSALFQQ